MSIEKMEFVNISGHTKDLDAALVKLSECGCFHIESASKVAKKKSGYITLKEENPYTPLLRTLNEISARSGISFKSMDFSDVENDSLASLEKYLSDVSNTLDEYKTAERQAREQLSVHEQAMYQVDHLQGITADFQQIFHCEYIKIRLGRLPADSFAKLPYYDDKPFFFIHFSQEQEYYWGMYLVPAAYLDEVEEIFDELYFERTRIPDFVHGDAETASSELHKMVEEDKKEIESCVKQLNEFMLLKTEKLCKIFSRLKTQHDNFDLRNKAVIVNDKFCIVGFVPRKDSERFAEMLGDIESVEVTMQHADVNGKLPPPIKLKDNSFSKPFSLFVEMYGLPSYNGINPTNFVAITYMLLFGIMFGDFGQGVVLAIFGALMGKFKKWAMGPIISRVGISAAIFGLLFGSVFGYEELLDPVYERLGISFLPIKVMDNVAPILVATIAFGVLLIMISILINIVSGIKNKDYENALFSNNGIAGLVFFGSILGGLVGTLLGAKVFSVPYVLLLIVLPLVLMFMREPLACMVKGKKYKMEGGVVDFIAANFFEVFEFLLSYVSNSLSFVRVGGFAISHASMMLVVMALAKGMSGAASPFMVVFGNAFVMGIEALLVCIQAMRLEFYELFSRFYSGDGVPFTPVKINYDETIE
ncbi:MAG: ATPase [Oscillospiraceae bacterium]|nr:ATPase [Oscillospiraceae bacterium]